MPLDRRQRHSVDEHVDRFRVRTEHANREAGLHLVRSEDGEGIGMRPVDEGFDVMTGDG